MRNAIVRMALLSTIYMYDREEWKGSGEGAEGLRTGHVRPYRGRGVNLHGDWGVGIPRFCAWDRGGCRGSWGSWTGREILILSCTGSMFESCGF